MSAKNRKLVEFYDEQMRRSEERMANTQHANDRGVSEVGAAAEPHAADRVQSTACGRLSALWRRACFS